MTTSVSVAASCLPEVIGRGGDDGGSSHFESDCRNARRERRSSKGKSECEVAMGKRGIDTV